MGVAATGIEKNGGEFQMPAEPVEVGWKQCRGEMVFTLLNMQADANGTRVFFAMDGLPLNYAPEPGLPRWHLELPGGKALERLPWQGGASGGGDDEHLSDPQIALFAPLPQDAQRVDLVITHNWLGDPQTWRLPVRISN